MKRFRVLVTVTITVLLVVMAIPVLSACQSGQAEAHIPITTVPEGETPPIREPAADDILTGPSGVLDYRANGFRKGVENIETTDTVLSCGSDEAHVTYRDFIETEAGEFRYNIIRVIIPDKDMESVSLYAVDVPDGISLTRYGASGDTTSVLMITVSPNTPAGQYKFEIGLEIDEKDYGTVPCTIEVFGKG